MSETVEVKISVIKAENMASGFIMRMYSTLRGALKAFLPGAFRIDGHLTAGTMVFAGDENPDPNYSKQSGVYHISWCTRDRSCAPSRCK